MKKVNPSPARERRNEQKEKFNTSFVLQRIKSLLFCIATGGLS
jgi:hypothetical protein